MAQPSPDCTGLLLSKFFMNVPMKCIYVINPISGRGHLDSYARLYCRALVELGYAVVLISETDGGTTEYLARQSPNAQQLFTFVSFNEAQCWDPDLTPERPKMSAAQRARLVLQEEGMAGIAVRCIRVPRRILVSRVPPHIRDGIRQRIRPMVRALLNSAPARAINLASFLDAGRISFRTLMGYVDKALTMPGRPTPNLLFFLYLDLMTERSRNTAPLDRVGAWPWIGILFHPRLARDSGARTEGYFKSHSAQGGVFLVPTGIAAYAAAVPGLHFALVPDVADLELPAAQPALADEIRRHAGNRIVVLQIGSIAPHKGITTLLDVIAMADPDRFFFAIVGEVYWTSFGENEQRVRRALAQPPENVFVHQGYLASEHDYNGLVAASDIVYAVYQDFDSSSNSLTKAAGLRCPILVNQNSLMGRRVLASGIGAVAPQNDAKATLAALEHLADRPKDSFNFDCYQNEHSLEALKSVLAEALPVWLAGAPRPELSGAPISMSARSEH
jgi:glycosyltransferase involved in cell wall biosynthesis